MTPNDFTTDPSLVNAEWSGAAADEIERQQDEVDRQETLKQAEAAEQQLAEQEEIERTTTPDGRELSASDTRRDGTDWWNPLDVGAELWAAGTGGIRDTASMGLTAVERFQDMTSGEMEREIEEKGFYKPEFDPLGGDLNPITTTWWGDMIRGTVHFGTSAAALVFGAKALAGAGVTVGIKSLAGATSAKALGAFGSTVVRGGMIGATTDLLSEYSQEDNAMGALKERFPFMDNPLATQDTDSPWMKTFKNVAEGLGIGVVLDGAGKAISRLVKRKGKPPSTKAATDSDKRVDGYFDQKEKEARAQAQAADKARLDEDLRAEYFRKNNLEEFDSLSPEAKDAITVEYWKRNKSKYSEWSPENETPIERADRKSLERQENVNEQILEEGERQLESPEFGAYKNKPLAESDQGAPVSTGKTLSVMRQQREIRRQGFDGDLGSTDALVTPAQVRRSNEIADIEGKELNNILQKSLGDDRFRRLYDEVKAEEKTPRQVFKESYKSYQEIVEGRNTSGLSLEEFWKPIDEELTFRTGGKDSMEAWAMQNVVTADLVNASLFKELRDYGIAAREANNVLNVWDVDGPAQAIRDRLIYGIMNVKRSRMLISQEFRRLRDVEGADAAAKVFNDRMKSMYKESQDAVDMMYKIAMEAPSKDLQDALLESFSMSNKITNWEDLHAWMKSKLMGGEFKGKKNSSALVKELQGVMINSILSGPKTPIRAIMGTTIAGFARPLSQAIGGAITFNGAQTRQGLSAVSAMVEAIPEAFSLFKTKLNSYWTGDVSTLKTRFSNYEKADADFNAMLEFTNKYGTDAEKAAAWWANTARSINNNSFFSYSTKIMMATDDAFGHIMARARARQKAMKASLEVQSAKTGNVPIVDKKLMKEFEDRFYSEFLDEDGNIDFSTDKALKYAQQEATLTKDLSGFSAGMENLFNAHPWAKPFFLFARTGVNGIELTMKHMPGFNLLVKDERRIFNATSEMANNQELANIGITNGWELENAKAIQKGRLALGTGIVSMASMAFMSDRLTGNGPMDAAQKKTWLAAGWQPRSIKIGDAWVSYDALEPFNSILAYVADVGDNMELMGPEWGEEKLFRIPMVLAQSATSKSYLAGLNQLVELLSGNPANAPKILANLMNNQLPLGGIRNEIGKLINPYMKELNTDLMSQLRNRNQWAETLTGGNKLPIKYDILTGKPIKDHQFATRMFNMFSPVQLNLENSPGRTLLFNSGYDVNIAVYSNPDGVNLKDYPEVRSMYQKAMGDQNLEAKLNQLASRKDVQESVREMEKARISGRDLKDPKTFLANKLISQMFTEAQAAAWAEVARDPSVQQLITAQRELQASGYTQIDDPSGSNTRFDRAQDLLNMYK